MKKFKKHSRMAELCPYMYAIKKRISTNLTLGAGIAVAAILVSLFQQKAYPQSLAIGDKVPAVRLDRVVHYPSAEINLPNDKLIILDFWATWCCKLPRKLGQSKVSF